MKTNKIKYVMLLLLVGTAFSSCSSDDSNDESIPDNTKQTNAYSITLPGEKPYANAWNLEDDYEDGAMLSFFKKNEAGDKGITLSLSDQKYDIIVSAGFSLKNGQPFPLEDLSEEWELSSNASTMFIKIGDVSYISTSGTAKLSNFETPFVVANVGAANYDLKIDGLFDNSETPKREQVKITGTFKVYSGL